MWRPEEVKGRRIEKKNEGEEEKKKKKQNNDPKTRRRLAILPLTSRESLEDEEEVHEHGSLGDVLHTVMVTRDAGDDLSCASVRTCD
jgi:hypothetical protein